MDSEKFVVGQVERIIDWKDFNEDCQTNAVKHETCEIENFNEFGKHATDFVDHDDYITHSYQELNEEKFKKEDLNPEVSDFPDYIKCSENWKIDCNDLNQAFQTELFDEKLDKKNQKREDLDHAENSWEKLSTSKVSIAQSKNEEYVDIFLEEIKCESEEVESGENFRFCVKCSQFECSCLKQNESELYNERAQHVTHDVKPTSLGPIVDSGLQQLVVQDDSLAGDGVTKEQDPHAVSQGMSMPHKKNGNMKCKFQCKFCSKLFSCESHLKIHERTHTGEKPFQCKICSKSFTRKDHFMRHARGHADETPFCCKICSKSFSRMDNLKVHERSHADEKQFECEICLKSFTRLGNLKVHVRSHAGVKPFKCKKCSKTFGHMVSLKSHEISHTGEKPFKCKLCSKSFSRMDSFKVHERGHASENLLHCKICSKSFIRTGDLKVHERTHTGEKPFHCRVCSKSYSQIGNLIRHERSHKVI